MSQVYRVADFIIDFFASKGTKDIFMLPGGGAMFLNDALQQNSKVNFVPCLHEQAAVISAEAYSRIDEKIGVAMVTSGPGATNAITPVAGAWIESVPLIIISGQAKSTDLKRGSGLRQKGVQEVDIISMVKEITKYSKTLKPEDDFNHELNKAYQLAIEGRKGPVWLDIPLDVQGMAYQSKTDQIFSNDLISKSDSIQHIFSNEQKLLLQKFLGNSKKPLLLLGHGLRLAGLVDYFRGIVDELGLPILTTWNALDILDFDHDLLVGRPGTVAMRAGNFAVQNCDLIISIGSSLGNIITAYTPSGFARNAKKVIVDIDQNELNKFSDFDLLINTDFLQVFEVLLEAKKNDLSSWKSQCNSWKYRYKDEDISEKENQQKKDISHFQFVKALSKALPEDQLIVTGSSGLAVEFFYTFFENKLGQRVFLTSGLGAMGFGLPAAIGACYSNNKQETICVESDGSLQLNIQELSTLRRNDIPIKVFILNNNGYASIRNTQRNYFEGRHIGTDHDSGLFIPSFEDIAKTYQLKYFKIDNKKSILDDIKYALEHKGPAIIDVQLEHNAALGPKVSAIPLANGSMASMPLEDMSPLLSLLKLKEEMSGNILDISVQARKGALE
ncbi:MAG: thiamine pyrophosphate-binding protein [Candidatus Caenarcaniphilales bacterium]|nr:thiamine pyrophosphate-binding protein [Candidatus Caenarcaniphilales bacterium]